MEQQPPSWWSWSSSSLSSSSKGFCLWKIQHFLELFFCMNSLSTVPSFHETFFFFFFFSTRTKLCACSGLCGCAWEPEYDDDDGSGFSRVTVVVTLDDDEATADLAAPVTGLAMAGLLKPGCKISESFIGFFWVWKIVRICWLADWFLGNFVFIWRNNRSFIYTALLKLKVKINQIESIKS